jgi:quaternary ammonium compound-resistance protein SugE
MASAVLVAAGLFETAFAVFLKLSHGLTQPWPTAGFAVSALISFGLLTVALRELEVGAAYAVWTGIGAAGAATVGMAFLGDAVSAGKLVSIGLILTGGRRPQPVRRHPVTAWRVRLLSAGMSGAAGRTGRSARCRRSSTVPPRSGRCKSSAPSHAARWCSGISAPGERAWPVKVPWCGRGGPAGS